jgi:hypothetical protein
MFFLLIVAIVCPKTNVFKSPPKTGNTTMRKKTLDDYFRMMIESQSRRSSSSTSSSSALDVQRQKSSSSTLCQVPSIPLTNHIPTPLLDRKDTGSFNNNHLQSVSSPTQISRVQEELQLMKKGMEQEVNDLKHYGVEDVEESEDDEEEDENNKDDDEDDDDDWIDYENDDDVPCLDEPDDDYIPEPCNDNNGSIRRRKSIRQAARQCNEKLKTYLNHMEVEPSDS